jgi:uncharacterized protein with HEPN domain
MTKDRLYLINIAECIARIELYTSSGYESFMKTMMIQDAVIRNFEVMGEATKRLSPEIRETYPQIQWQQIAGFRDVLIHDYLKVNLRRVWGVIERDLPPLKTVVREMLEALDNS